MYKSLTFIITALLLPLSHAYGKNITDAIVAALQDKNVTRQERVEIAQAFNNECNSILKLVPILSPKENEWLDNEISNRGAVSVIASPEFGKRKLYNVFYTCVRSTNYILKEDDTIKEALGWSGLLSALVEIDIYSYMKRSGIDNIVSKSDSTKAIFIATPSLIINNILMPLLHKKTLTISSTRPFIRRFASLHSV